MANKMYEIAFRIAAAVDGRFNSAFMSAADKMSALDAKTRKLKSSMNNIDKMYGQGALTAAEYGRALAKVGNEIERNERLQKRMARLAHEVCAGLWRCVGSGCKLEVTGCTRCL